MIHKIIRRLLAVALVSAAFLPSSSMVNPPARAAGVLYRCPGAEFQFPLIDGWVGWLYADKRSIGTDISYWHTGIDIYPPIQGNTADVYPLASGYLHQVNWVPNSTKIYYPDQGVTSYMGHVVLNDGLKDGDQVFPDKPIGKLLDLRSNAHLHLSMKYTNGFAHYNDQALFDETHQTEADDPSDAFNANLKDPSGASNPYYSTYPYYRRPYQDFCRSNAVDVFLLVDLSQSFANDLPVFKAQAPTIISALKASNPNTRFGLGKYEDYPIRPFGDSDSGDKAYERLVDLTDNTELLLATINGLVTRDGGDDPESQLVALYQAATGEGQNLSGVDFPGANIPAGQHANFRDGAEKLFLLWTDASFHQPGDPGAIPYPGPSFDEAVAAIKALDSPMVMSMSSDGGGVANLESSATVTSAKVIGISSGGGGTADLEAMAAATDAFAPASGVDCNSDGIVDILPGEPLVCSIGDAGEGIAEAIIALVEVAAEPIAEAPKHISPPDGQVFYTSPLTTTLTTTLQWRSVPNAVSYNVEIDCFHCCVVEEWCTDVGEVWDINSGIVETTFTFDFVGAQPGRWRVWAVFPGGIEGSKSDWWTFEYLPAIPGAP